LSGAGESPGPRTTLSFVIPAFNESANIGRCVGSIQRHVPQALGHEVIVVDNGSTDDTPSIASRAGARILPSDASTIAGVRNAGAAAAKGSILVFLDGDCALTPEWEKGIGDALRRIEASPKSCGGSQVSAPHDQPLLLTRHWFVPFMERANHIGSAHLFCLRETFEGLRGFDESLETGEDHDFCRRVRAGGGEVFDFPNLAVAHYDFPKSWAEFVRRERWHGRGDTTSLRAIASSKVALMSLFFSGLVLTGFVGLVMGSGALALAALVLAASLLVVSSALRLRNVRPSTRLFSVVIFAVYYFARTLAVVDAVLGRPAPRG